MDVDDDTIHLLIEVNILMIKKIFSQFVGKIKESCLYENVVFSDCAHAHMGNAHVYYIHHV